MKKRGFTLIELLAVIVILSIIALIATPIILNVISDSRKKAAEESLKGYMDAIEKRITESDLDDESIEIANDKCYDVPTINKHVEVKGNKPTAGNVCITNESVVSVKNIIIDGYTLQYENGEITISK